MTLPLSYTPRHELAEVTDLERLWLECACAYEVFDDPLMEDHEWDRLGVDLWKRSAELSAYFCHAVNIPWPHPRRALGAGTNPLKTGSGIRWDRGLPAIVEEGLRKERPKRIAMWQARLRTLER